MTLNDRRGSRRIYDVLTLALASVGVFIGSIGLRADPWWAKLIGVLFAIGVTLIVYGIFIEPRFLKVARFREKLVDNPGTWVRIVFCSDLHAGGTKPSSWYERLAIEAQALDPDIFVLGGDLVDDIAEKVTALKPLAGVQAHIGRYFLLGNHDFLENPSAVRQAVASWGFSDLTNASLTVKKDGHVMQITGLDDHWHGRPLVPPYRASRELPHVTITHQPDAIMDVSPGDTDLMLAGHTHGGQIRLPLVGAITPIPAHLGRKVDGGRKVLNGVPLIISHGAAESDSRARLFCPAQIVVVEVGI